MKNGKIYVVGLGPGGYEQMTPRAAKALADADSIVGYKTYMDLVRDFDEVAGKERIVSGMRSETDRCREVIELAKTGKDVALISSGDAGVYGMAGILLELLEQEEDGPEAEIIPGISAANTAAAALGAPLMHDYCVISLSDLLTPWELIEKRLRCAAEGDFVVALYNPKSRGRQDNLRRACQILMEIEPSDRPAGIVKNAGRDGETVTVTTLGELADCEVDMLCTVIIGNSQSYITGGGERIITPRGYRL